MAAPADATVGYAQLDDKGRLLLGKPVRQALGIGAGSTVAYVKVGDALMIIPQDAHLAELMGAAQRVLEQAHISVDDMLAELPRVREEVVVAHYGADFLDALEKAAEEEDVLTGGR